jgi:hypothetical protein
MKKQIRITAIENEKIVLDIMQESLTANGNLKQSSINFILSYKNKEKIRLSIEFI